MQLSQNGLNLIKSFESCRLTAYKAVPTETYWTIGWGHYGPDVYEGMTITQEEADALLLSDCQRFVNHVNSFTMYSFTQNEFDALVSFAFNVGSITQLTANGTRDKATIAEKILEYNKSGGVVLPGLVTRRQKEHDLFVSDADYGDGDDGGGDDGGGDSGGGDDGGGDSKPDTSQVKKKRSAFIAPAFVALKRRGIL